MGQGALEYASAVGTVVMCLYSHILDPIYVDHPEMAPPSWSVHSETERRQVMVEASAALDILPVRSSLSQLKLLPSMARLTVRMRTQEKSWR